MRNAFLAVVAASSIGAAMPSRAGPPFRHAAPRDRSGPNLPSPGAPVPSAQQGCVPLCGFDSAPCDPPAFNQADGRCNRA